MQEDLSRNDRLQKTEAREPLDGVTAQFRPALSEVGLMRIQLRLLNPPFLNLRSVQQPAYTSIGCKCCHPKTAILFLFQDVSIAEETQRKFNRLLRLCVLFCRECGLQVRHNVTNS